MKNNNCDNNSCSNPNGEVRLVPLNKHDSSNLILCRSCFNYEIIWRKERNKALGNDSRFDLPEWESLKVSVPRARGDEPCMANHYD